MTSVYKPTSKVQDPIRPFTDKWSWDDPGVLKHRAVMIRFTLKKLNKD